MKNKQNIINIILFAGILFLAGLKIFKQEKVMYVDTPRILQEYEAMKDARMLYEMKSNKWKANADTLMQEWQTELKKYEKERKNMTSKERRLQEELLQSKQQQIAQYQEAIRLKAREEEQKLTQEVVNRVNEFVTEFGKKKGYTYILGANGSGNVVYAKDAHNVTDLVLEGLQAAYKKGKKK